MAKELRKNLRPDLRSKLALPPRINAKKDVEAKKSSSLRQEVGYNMLTWIQYLSADMPRFDGVDIQLKGAAASLPWSITGRGRTFLVRRFPTGNEMDEFDMMRPSHALKCLRSSHLSSADEDSMRYRSLIQELRILRHPPLIKHPHFLRIFEASWELDLMDGTKVLPTISTEFATWGTLQNFLLCIESEGLDWPGKRRLLLDVVEGISALHACSIVHGDLKMENVLVVPTPEDPECPMIAKLSDFGFSIDISPQQEPRSLVGFTPLWAAPEYTQDLSPEGLKLTDVYSLGFIVWSVAICGRNPFEEFQKQHEEADSTDGYVGMFNFLKETNEMLGFATSHVEDEAGDLPDDIFKCCTYLSHTLQLEPAQRNLQFLLEGLRNESGRRKDEHKTLNIQFAPLVPFDFHKVRGVNRQLCFSVSFADSIMQIQINKWYFQRRNLSHIVLEQVLHELEYVTSGETPTGIGDFVGPDSSVIWRFPLDYCDRKAAAAFTLCHAKLYRPDVQKSIETALRWLSEAARKGHTFARALCGRLSNLSGIQISFQGQLEWLQGAAKIGSRIALSQLKERDEATYFQCFEYFRKDFWASVYAIPNVWKAVFQISEDISDKLASLMGTHPDQVTVGDYGCSPLHCAAMIGSVQGVKFLISGYGLSVNSTNDRSETPLFLACRSGHVEVVEYLVSIGADAGICNTFAENGLHWLDSFEDHCVGNLAASLCYHGAKIDAIAQPDNTFFPAQTRCNYSQWFPGTPLQRAVVSGNLAAICALLECGASLSVQYRGLNAIDRAAQLHQADILDVLLAHDPSVNLNEERISHLGNRLSPIHRVIESVDKLQLLYVHGENFDQALDHTMSVIFAHGIDLRKMTTNLVHYAVQKGNSEALQRMLEYQYLDVNKRETEGDIWTATPLMKAIYNEDEESVELLLRYGADAKADLRFMTAACFSTLHLCISYWHEKTRVAEMLIEHGADVNHNKDPGASDSPLLYALLNNRFHIADLLIRHGARPSICAPEARHGNIIGELLWSQPGRLMYNAIRFLAEHPSKPDIPFITFPAKQQSVFHTICSSAEIRRKCVAPADFLAIFAILLQIFPDPHLTNIPDGKDFTPLQYATWWAFPEAVRVLLSAGADPFYFAGPRASGEGDIPPIPRGMSVVEMVQKDKFCPLYGFAKVNAEERAEWDERRNGVRALIEPYM
jgi:ankyrin repeat protein/serine/threonine protein kinase